MMSLAISNTIAQTYNPRCRYTAVGFNIKASYFDGDIATPIQYIRPGIGANISRRVTPRISLIGEVMWLRLMGDDHNGSNLQTPNKIPLYIRNLHFRNDVKEASAGLKYDLFPSINHYRRRPVYNLYGTVGLSFFYHNPKAKVYSDSTLTKSGWVNLRPLKTENKEYSKFQMAIPLAVGIRYKLSLQWDLEIEVGYRYTFTDYLDDVSGNYPEPSSLKSNLAKQLSNRTAEVKSALSGKERDVKTIQNSLGHPLISTENYNYFKDFGPGSPRGSKKGNDRYIIFGIRFLYAIPGYVDCPKFR